MQRFRSLCVLGVLLGAVAAAQLPAAADGDSPELRTQAAAALRRAVGFFRDRVATHGGYLWRYSEDLSRREGEGRASETTVWVQPPGTPSVGMAILKAYQATGDSYYLEAAREAGYCLVQGQLRSGGWDYRIEFDPRQRRRYAYRVDHPAEGTSSRNTSTLDDNTTQAALRLLMRLDQALEFKDAAIHEAAEYGLQRLLEVQYPIGAWPQRFVAAPDPRAFPVRKADYPPRWSRTYPRRDYSHDYTFNDHAISDVIDVMWEAWQTYDKPPYRAAAERAGQFILLAQMPEPQPAWAQQYDAQMHPAWARKFEPPAITGGESQGVMRTLLQLYRYTADRKYLEPIPRAIAYFRRSVLPDGQLARFYELKTNRPLYFTKKYQLTYSDADMPTHYAFKVGNGIESIEREYRRLLELKPDELASEASASQSGPPRPNVQQVQRVITALDDQGRWVERGSMHYHGPDDSTQRIIDCRTFINHVAILAAYLQQ